MYPVCIYTNENHNFLPGHDHLTLPYMVGITRDCDKLYIWLT